MIRQIRRNIVSRNSHSPKPEYYCLVCLRPQRDCVC